jgi:Tol biopolymer transport system component
VEFLLPKLQLMKKLLIFVVLFLILNTSSCSNHQTQAIPVLTNTVSTKTLPQLSEIEGKILIQFPKGLFLASVDGKGGRLILPQIDGLLDAALSPDGARVAYFINGFYFVKDLQMAATSQLNQEFIGGIPYGMGWSPDGKQIGFDCVPPNAHISEICALDVAKKSFQVLTQLSQTVPPDESPFNGGAKFGSWGQDGFHIVYTVNFYPAAGGRSKGNIKILDIRTGKVDTIFNEGEQSSISGIGAPALSPDGKTVLFQGDVGQLTEIFQINTDGSGLRQVTLGNHTSDITYPVWSPAGNAFFAFTASDIDPNKIGVPILFSLNGDILLQLDVGSGRVRSWGK